ncbi:MAG: RNA polymerase sigma factor RpoD/SigA [Bacilli bacterium]|nr:RNA polymerase sigma factor RpoD/SigA [Bacilli bacterium]
MGYINDLKCDYCEDLNCMSIYFNDISRFKVLSREEEIELFKRIKKGDEEAKNTIIECNLKLVVSIAKKYYCDGFSFQDLIQEGNIGLMIAVDKYDYTYGFRFSTYAKYWIRQRIGLGIGKMSRNIKFPFYIHEYLISFKKVYCVLEMKLQRNPSVEEIAKEMNLSVNFVKFLQSLQDDTLSLNELVKADEELEYENLIVVDDKCVEDIIMDNELKRDVNNLLLNSFLTDKELQVISLRYGFYDGKVYSLEDIANLYGISRQAVFNLERKIYVKLLKSKEINKLAEYSSNKEEALKNIDNYLNDLNNFNNGKYYLRFISNYYNLLAEERGYNKDVCDNLVNIIFTNVGLNDIEMDILMYRYEFNGRERLGFKRIGELHDISTTEIKNMYLSSIKKVGGSSYICSLVDNYRCMSISDNKKKKILQK